MPFILIAVFMAGAITPACAQKKSISKEVKAILSKGTAPVKRPSAPRASSTLSGAAVSAAQVVPLATAVERQMANALRKPRLLSSKEIKKILFPQGNGDLLYVPLPLNTPETAVYRGFALPDLDSLENIAKNGLELNKIQVENAIEYAIFTSHQLGLAFHHSLPLSDEKATIPVIVKIPVTKQCKPLGYNGHFVFTRDVSAKHISEIMAFLEIDGKATWYKVSWQNDKMILAPAPSQPVTPNELMVHYFQTWPINLDMD